MSERIAKTAVIKRLAELTEAERQVELQLIVIRNRKAELEALLTPAQPIITHGEEH